MTASCLAGISLALLSNHGASTPVTNTYAPPCAISLEVSKTQSQIQTDIKRLIVVPDCKSCTAQTLKNDLKKAAQETNRYAVAVFDGSDNGKGYPELSKLPRVNVSSPSGTMPCFGTFLPADGRGNHLWELEQ